MRTMFDNSLGFRNTGGPFLGLNFPKLFQDAQPLIQDARNLVKNQGATQTVTPTAQPPLVPVPRPVDNSTMYLLLGALAIGGLGAAWYVLRKKKPAAAGAK